MANFTKPMEWNNKGVEPSETLKNQGFKGGYKPPAEVFNYFLNNIATCITELQIAEANAQNTVEQLVQRAAIKRDIIIPTTGWATGAEESKEGDMYVDIIQEDVTEDMVPIISILPAHMDTAKECGMSTTSRTIPGAVRLYAKNAPAAEIQANLILLLAYSGTAGGANGGGTSADYVLPTATATRLGGVKIGDNVNVSQDGTISVDGIELLDDAVATDEEIKETLDGVLSPKDSAD